MTEKERYQQYLAGREWGLKREAVRRRCGGLCERCRHHPMDLVHHLTYIRKYQERLEDLQSLCRGCHDFTHGRSDLDPILGIPVVVCGEEIKSVYLAGKIAKDGWRSTIIPSFSAITGAVMYHWPTLRGVIPLPDGRSLDYVGPYAMDNEHGGFVYARHRYSRLECEDSTDLDVPDLCLESIREADMVFAWIESLDCYGTIAEIGYAKSLGKPILISGEWFFPDLWFTYALSSRVHLLQVGTGTARDAFVAMVVGGQGVPFRKWKDDQRHWCHRDPIDEPGGYAPDVGGHGRDDEGPHDEDWPIPDSLIGPFDNPWESPH